MSEQQAGRPARRHHRHHHDYHHTHEECPATPPRPQLSFEEALTTITPFQLFSAYHLGITESERFKLVSVPEIAKRFNTTPANIDNLLSHYHLTKEELKTVKNFDLSLARLDVQVAPEGISRTEIAKQIYEEFKLGPAL